MQVIKKRRSIVKAIEHPSLNKFVLIFSTSVTFTPSLTFFRIKCLNEFSDS